MTTFGCDYWRQASYSDLITLQTWCTSLSDRCWKTGESGLWTWFASICQIEAERRTIASAEPLHWDLPSMFYSSPSRIAAAALDARALLTLCETDEQRAMVDRLLFELLNLLMTATAEEPTEQAVESK